MYPKECLKYIFYVAVENTVSNPMPDEVKSLIQDSETWYFTKSGPYVAPAQI